MTGLEFFAGALIGAIFTGAIFSLRRPSRSQKAEYPMADLRSPDEVARSWAKAASAAGWSTSMSIQALPTVMQAWERHRALEERGLVATAEVVELLEKAAADWDQNGPTKYGRVLRAAAAGVQELPSARGKR